MYCRPTVHVLLVKESAWNLSPVMITNYCRPEEFEKHNSRTAYWTLVNIILNKSGNVQFPIVYAVIEPSACLSAVYTCTCICWP